MEKKIIEKINRINEEFYQTFAESFSATRGRVQPGVTRLLDQMPQGGSWLDIGCGNGTLAQAWIEAGRTGHYVGCDFSAGLIREARKKAAALEKPAALDVDFFCLDITQSNWSDNLPEKVWDGASLFAVLHHIPGSQQRQSLCSQISRLLQPGRHCLVSVWQLQNSPRLLSRIQPWQTVGIANQDIEEGDVLMNWRACSEAEGSKALRYVHIFSQQELANLAESADFQVEDSFYSDGKEGNLALYQIWKR